MPFVSWITRAFFCFCLMPGGPAAAAGDLDPTYASQGFARLTGASTSGPQALVVLPNGSTVFASSRPTTTHDIVVGALNREGHPDTRFAAGGLLTITSAGTLYRPLLRYDARTDKTLLAASDFRNGAYHLLLCRIRQDGTLDPTFSTAGYTSQTGCVSIPPPAFAATGILVAGFQPLADGRILVGGSAYNFAANSFRAFEGRVTPLDVNPAETPAINDVPNLSDVYINAVAFDPPMGDVYFAGLQRFASGDSALIAVRLGVSNIESYLYNANNVANGTEEARAITFAGVSDIYVAGTIETAGGKSDCMAFRLNRNMQPNFSFGPGSNGRRTVRFNGAALDSASCEAVMTDAQGGVYVAGRVGLNGDQTYESAVAKLTTGGDFAAGFGLNGVARPAGGSNPARSERALAIGLHLGRVILAGPSELATGATPETTDMVLARLTHADVIFDNGFN
ncbi:hypothetical protein [Tahibacter caeni]|uniref:hypothetical protein n=1 Tax=Tahibacter caeni TaxID=1453545 RepID=UPI0021473C0C|nr:hypothetical protein [Tahibacter caeni]